MITTTQTHQRCYDAMTAGMGRARMRIGIRMIPHQDGVQLSHVSYGHLGAVPLEFALYTGYGDAGFEGHTKLVKVVAD